VSVIALDAIFALDEATDGLVVFGAESVGAAFDSKENIKEDAIAAARTTTRERVLGIAPDEARHVPMDPRVRFREGVRSRRKFSGDETEYFRARASYAATSAGRLVAHGLLASGQMPELDAPMKTPTLVLSMLLAVGLVALVVFLDGERESQSALEDFARDQSTIAESVAASLSTRVGVSRSDASTLAEDLRNGRASTVTHVLERVERSGTLRVFLVGPGDERLHALDGRTIESKELIAALASGSPSLRIPRERAHMFGLPARTAVAGLSRVDAGALGTFGVVVMTTAERERDRELRARWRLIFGVTVAATIVLVFGSIAMRRQRRELSLEADLQLAAVRQERDERLERANRAATMGTLATGVAHEVATPLGVILGRAEQLLPRVESDERARKSVQAILEQTERISRVIRGFLNLARGEAHATQEVAPIDVLEGAVGLVEHRFSKAGVTIRVEVAKSMPEIRGDLGMLQHVLVNLLLNACDACERGGRVRASAEGDRNGVTFVVEDDGAGISKEAAARATEPFFTTKPVGRGTGLGLAIANEIVKGHRGSLTIAPSNPRGTRVVVHIPSEVEHAVA